MKPVKYVGMDVHKAMTVIAVIDSTGKILAEAIIETKGSTILEFLKSQRGTLHVAFEEGTQAAWLYDLIRPRVASVIVCDPREGLSGEATRPTNWMRNDWRNYCAPVPSGPFTTWKRAPGP